jgi:hypothetical protein
MALSVGQHTNDKELSFYPQTPSGFEWGGRLEPGRRRRGDLGAHHAQRGIRGHTPVGQTVIDKLARFRQAARSLRRAEETVPALSGAGFADG